MPDEPTYVMLNLTIQNKHHENTCYLLVVLQSQNFHINEYRLVITSPSATNC